MMSIKATIDKILPKRLKSLLHICYHRGTILLNKVRWALFGKDIADYKNIPIIINNFNRLSKKQKVALVDVFLATVDGEGRVSCFLSGQ